MSAKPANMVVNVNVSIKVPTDSGRKHRSHSVKSSATQHLGVYNHVLHPCRNPLSSSKSLPDVTVNRTVRNDESIAAMGHALPDCFESNPYHQVVSPNQRSLNKSERYIDSLRDIALLPDLFTKSKDSSAVSIKEEVHNDYNADAIGTSPNGRGRWYSNSSLLDLEKIPSLSKQVCVCENVDVLRLKDISVSPNFSPKPPSFSPLQSYQFGGDQSKQIDGVGHFSLKSLQEVFSKPHDYFKNHDDTKTVNSPQSSCNPAVDRRYSVDSLRDLAKLPNISKMDVNGKDHLPQGIYPPTSHACSPYNRSQESVKQYYTLDSSEAPIGFNGDKRTVFFVANPMQPSDEKPFLLFAHPSQVRTRSVSTNPYAYLPKERPSMSSDSLADIKKVQLTFSPKKQEKKRK